MVGYSNGSLKTGLQKACLWSKMSGIQIVHQVTCLIHLNTRHPKCPVFRCPVFKWVLYRTLLVFLNNLADARLVADFWTTAEGRTSSSSAEKSPFERFTVSPLEVALAASPFEGATSEALVSSKDGLRSRASFRM